MKLAQQELTQRQSLMRLGICIVLTILLWMIPIPEDMPKQAWHVLAVFISVIISFVLRPFPMGAMVLFGLIAMMVTKTLTSPASPS